MLKRSVILFSLFIYLAVSFQPLMILLSYEVNYDYIKNVLCENKDNVKSCCKGKCYLNKEMKKSDNESKEQILTRNNLSEHLTSFFEYHIIINSELNTGSFTIAALQPSLKIKTPPPKFS